ncbi:UvrD-helicase domain-containing protein [Seonamhaeicola sp. MEBiC1930]|uniref:UvrD-helicase domain-containing protein n=1 Tax=Seonamhaeicola sp. MEBiC01930 TaxID=2976768 RepID=UPI00324B2632
MNKNPSFTIYNASAGSGKTFTLVKEYLKILLKSNTPETFKQVLAITFTNKAVAEMKERIIETLKQFSNISILSNSNSMFNAICKELQMDANLVHNKSKTILNSIIFNYAAFDISTIDGFTHKLIRTFAHDLKLPLNFEVELDQHDFLNLAVDSLIAKAGTDEALTNALVDFAIEKADDDKSWDIALDFNKIAKLLVNENDIPFIETLKDKTLSDFKTLKNLLKKDIEETINDIIEKSNNILTLFEEAGLEFNDFSRGSLPNHFKNLSNKNFNIKFDSQWQTGLLEGNTLYPKRVTEDIAATIEQIQPEIKTVFNNTKQQVFQLKFLKNFHKNITPLSVLNAINNELKQLKEEQNKMLISEFNTIISNEIKDQPTPFIYERIGEKFRHYFIDEFQDTSVKQWNNLIPLIDNSLSAEKGSAMLVGDAKQAIYRWRGGKAEQFIELFNNKNPFYTNKLVKNLPTNYRSFKEVINFNNGFFKFLAHQVFSNKDYEQLYENGSQNTSIENSGYVELSFLEIDKDDDRDEIFSNEVLKTINNCIDSDYRLEDICVLVRRKKEGVSIANYLSQNNIPIVSSETLLIYNSPEVVFINDLLSLLIQPKNNEIKVAVLNYLTSLFNIDDKHSFFINHLNLELPLLLKSFEKYKVYINDTHLIQLPLFDLVETIVRSFNLTKNSNAYIQFFLDIALEFTQKKGSNISEFLEYFDKKKESLSIVSPVGQNAVQIMTIHKSKGLEFPVVIFPYADLDIYREVDPKVWFKLDAENYNGFPHTLLNFNRDFEHFGENGLKIFNKHQSELELDNINLLYVTLTRAIAQLYIISKKEISSKGDISSKKYSGLFINYLKHLNVWDDSQLKYTFGKPEKPVLKSISDKESIIQKEFISTSKESHNIKIVTKSGFLWNTNQQEAIEKGNLIHNIMSRIKTKDDIDFVISEYVDTSIINNEQANKIKETVLQIVNHTSLQKYFTSKYTIYNEQDIITKEGIILRPDRVVINSKNEAVIIDYKTGVETKGHNQQLKSYQDALENMKLTVTSKILIYINNEITLKII